MGSKNSRSRRKYFLLDSNQTVRRKPKKNRNRFLNTLARVLLLRQLAGVFRGSMLLGLVCALMGGFVIFALFSPYFDLKKVIVIRDDPHINVAAVEKSLTDFYDKNLLFIKKERAKEVLLQAFPEFREVSLREKWPDKLEIKIKLSPPLFTLINNFDASFSVMSADGVILEEVGNDNLTLIKIQDYDRPLVSGTRFFNKLAIEKIQLSIGLFEEELSLPIKEIRLFPLAQELHLIVGKETAYWIDLQLDVTEQIKKVELGARKIGIYSKDIEHVDLRIPNRVFWKPR